MPKTLYYTDQYTIPLPDGHRFPIQKYRMLRDMLTEGGAFAFEPAPLAEREVVELAHDREYVEAFLQGTLSAQAVRRIGFPWSEGLVRRTLASVGGTLAATYEALQAGVDVLASDALGKLKLSPAGVQQRDEMVISTVKQAGLPLVITIGGGYSKPIELTAEAHATTFRTALKILNGINEAVA